jgi:hypothetical protein
MAIKANMANLIVAARGTEASPAPRWARAWGRP